MMTAMSARRICTPLVYCALLVCPVLLGGCVIAPASRQTIAPAKVREAIEADTLVKLRYVTAPVGTGSLQSMRASLTGTGRGGTIAALVFWDAPSSAMPLGGPSARSAALQEKRLPGGLLALRRLNVLVLYTRASAGPDLAADLRRALAAARAG